MGYHDSPSKTFLSHSGEKVRSGTLLCFTKFLVSKKFLEKRGEYQEFPWKNFCPTLPGNFVGEPISVSLFLGIDKFYTSEGCVTILCQKFVVSQCQNFS